MVLVLSFSFETPQKYYSSRCRAPGNLCVMCLLCLILYFFTDSKGECLGQFISINNDNNRINSIKVQSKYENNIKICTILLKTDINYRLRALVDYSPTLLPNCQSQFLHIGNDKLRPNQVSLTSYKYCDKKVSEEIVSRKNFLWIVYPVSGNSTDFRVSISARKEGNKVGVSKRNVAGLSLKQVRTQSDHIPLIGQFSA